MDAKSLAVISAVAIGGGGLLYVYWSSSKGADQNDPLSLNLDKYEVHDKDGNLIGCTLAQGSRPDNLVSTASALLPYGIVLGKALNGVEGVQGVSRCNEKLCGNNPFAPGCPAQVRLQAAMGKIDGNPNMHPADKWAAKVSAIGAANQEAYSGLTAAQLAAKKAQEEKAFQEKEAAYRNAQRKKRAEIAAKKLACVQKQLGPTASTQAVSARVLANDNATFGNPRAGNWWESPCVRDPDPDAKERADLRADALWYMGFVPYRVYRDAVVHCKGNPNYGVAVTDADGNEIHVDCWGIGRIEKFLAMENDPHLSQQDASYIANYRINHPPPQLRREDWSKVT